MKNKLLLLMLISVASTYAQKTKTPKVDLDRYSFSISLQRLPEVVVPFEKRTYNSTVSLAQSIYNVFPDANVLNNKLHIYGWKRVEQNPTLEVNVKLNEYGQSGSKINSEIVENKDKDGNVKERYTLYQLVADYYGSGVCYVNGLESDVTPPDAEKVSKLESKVNRFLQNTTNGAVTLDKSESKSTVRKNFNLSYQYSSEKVKNSSYEIEKNYRMSKNDIYNSYAKKFSNEVADGSFDFINYKYGFTPETYNDNLWIIDSEDEEGKIQKEAIDAVKVIFNTMKANEPIDDIKSKMQPLIEYFESLKTKYNGDDKGSKKIRYSAYFNLGKIYLYLDMPEKTIAEGEGLIANDYDKKDGTNLINEAKRLITVFERTKLNTRHNKIH
ncbi:hypothetical protein [Flavobacterium sp. H122]|uniref:hypothetical protein n=1 Tax=Flavobacterium sp. H122 TaxID=2529860 RepID=UPI0010A9B44C|nr:hypothetical protein [Flavobacterium sp. H122]